MPYSDSVDKIVTSYFTAITKESFFYKGRWHNPMPALVVSPLLFRGFTCPAGCGGCCPRFSLDYLPSEKRPSGTEKRAVEFNGSSIEIRSIMQYEGDHHCQFLDHQDGRCDIHKVNPFSCDFELIRFMIPSADSDRPARLTQKLFGRGWQLLRIDGERGALCTMTESTKQTTRDVARKLRRLQKWADHFGLKNTWLPELHMWAQTGPYNVPLELTWSK